MLHPIKRQILDKCDVMVDGPFILALRDPDLAFRGSSNQRIIDLKKSKEILSNIIDKMQDIDIKAPSDIVNHEYFVYDMFGKKIKKGDYVVGPVATFYPYQDAFSFQKEFPDAYVSLDYNGPTVIDIQEENFDKECEDLLAAAETVFTTIINIYEAGKKDKKKERIIAAAKNFEA